jgi:hypothetical protein
VTLFFCRSESSRCLDCSCLFPSELELALHRPQCSGDEIVKQSDSNPVPECSKEEHCEKSTVECDATQAGERELLVVEEEGETTDYEPTAIVNMENMANKPGTGISETFVCQEQTPGRISRKTSRKACGTDKVGKFRCRVCSADFALSSQRMEHETNEHAPQIHPCNVCDKSFVGISLLKKHKRLQHSSGDESAAAQRRKAQLSATRVDGKHVCHLCGKIYAHGNGLRLHIRTLHQGEQSYSCDSCPKRFGRPDSLVKHRRVHTRQQNFICEFCPRAFSQSSNLIKHRSIQHVDQEEWSRNLCAIFNF